MNIPPPPPSSPAELIFVIMLCIVVAAFTYSTSPQSDVDAEASKDDY